MEAAGLHAAYVLHSRRYGDSSLIVDLFVREQGRVACIAKGALRGKRVSPVKQPFQPLLVDVRGRGEVGTLARVETNTAPVVLTGKKLYCGLYVNELLLKLTARHDAHPLLFDEYAGAVRGLGADNDLEPILRHFEIRLLEELGLGMSLDRDSDGHAIGPECSYTYQVDTGPVKALATDARALRGKTLISLRSGRFADPGVQREARLLMRQVLDHHLDGRPLRSRELFR